MTLHPQISKPELVAYCELCHEHKIKSVRVDKSTAARVFEIVMASVEFMGVKFKIKQFPATAPAFSPALPGGTGRNEDLPF